MSLMKDLDEVYCAARHVSQGINALEVMTMGLAETNDPYAEGFAALFDYLSSANQELRQHLDACMNIL